MWFCQSNLLRANGKWRSNHRYHMPGYLILYGTIHHFLKLLRVFPLKTTFKTVLNWSPHWKTNMVVLSIWSIRCQERNNAYLYQNTYMQCKLAFDFVHSQIVNGNFVDDFCCSVDLIHTATEKGPRSNLDIKHLDILCSTNKPNSKVVNRVQFHQTDLLCGSRGSSSNIVSNDLAFDSGQND